MDSDAIVEGEMNDANKMLEWLKQIVRIAGLNGPRYGVPTWISRPQFGKTWNKRELAKLWGYRFVVINPALDLPEDEGGFPLVRDNQIVYSRPAFLPDTDEPVWILVDEVDKCRRELQVSLLTLFAERRIRDFYLKDNWMLSACMNEPRIEMEPALIERMLIMPFDQYPTFTSSTMNRVNKRWLPSDVKCRIPERDGSARGSAWRLDAWCQTQEWRTPEIREIIVRGLLNEQQAAVALAEFEAIEPKPVLDPVEWMKTKRYTEIVPELCVVLCSLDREAFSQTLLAWQKDRINNDKTGEWQRLLDIWAEEGVLQMTHPGGDGLAAQAKLDQALAAQEPKKKGKK